MNRLAAMTAILAAAFVACSRTAEVAPSVAPTAPILGPTEEKVSNRFWATASDFGPTAFAYTSLAEITEDADLIVVGRLDAIREGQALPVDDPGGELVARRLPFGFVRIIEVLKGAPIMRDPGGILVARLGTKDLAPGDLPREDFVIFLKNYQQLREEFGKGLFNDPSDRFYYARPNGYQDILRNINGVVRLAVIADGWEAAPNDFPSALNGQPFADVMIAIRQAVAAE